MLFYVNSYLSVCVMRSFVLQCVPHVCACVCCFRRQFSSFFFKKKGRHSELKADYSLHLAVIISAAFLSPAFSGWKLQMGPPHHIFKFIYRGASFVLNKVAGLAQTFQGSG